MSRRHSRWRRSSMTRRSLVTVSSTSRSSLTWSHATLCTTSSREAAAWKRSRATALSIVKQGGSWLSPTSMTLGLFWTPHSTTTPSRRPAHRLPEAQPATGVAHPVMQRPEYYIADEPGVHFVWQPNQESSVLVMSRVFDDYYIEDCGVILAPEVTQRRIDSSDQFIILATVRVAFVSACL
ncbi:putative protein phosphatase 2C 48 [Zea mays]|uniref:protein-serine/threonine phosphatase n=1 Tax=Zea mays TaxID=4577 RepID=A0A3L6G3R1_MAIZE|nr:putative protein phosphatase 2C 48 [Zea mays]